jgi:hypothetical protein
MKLAQTGATATLSRSTALVYAAAGRVFIPAMATHAALGQRAIDRKIQEYFTRGAGLVAGIAFVPDKTHVRTHQVFTPVAAVGG